MFVRSSGGGFFLSAVAGAAGLGAAAGEALCSAVGFAASFVAGDFFGGGFREQSSGCQQAGDQETDRLKHRQRNVETVPLSNSETTETGMRKPDTGEALTRCLIFDRDIRPRPLALDRDPCVELGIRGNVRTRFLERSSGVNRFVVGSNFILFFPVSGLRFPVFIRWPDGIFPASCNV